MEIIRCPVANEAPWVISILELNDAVLSSLCLDVNSVGCE